MKPNVFYTYLKKKKNASDVFQYFELYYKIELSANRFSKAWDPVLGQEPNGDYSIDLGGLPGGGHQIIELEDRSSPTNNAISLDGVIRITGVTEDGQDKKVTLRIKGGGVNQTGSTKHMGDGDG